MLEPFALPTDPASAWAAAPARPLLTPQGRALLEQVFEVGANGNGAASNGSTAADGIPPAIASAALEALTQALDGDAARVRTDTQARAAHANGMSYLDLLRHRLDGPLPLPDAVLEPASEEEVAAVLRIASERRIAVVPFGGGTSVVGGVSPARGDLPAVVALDLRRLDALVEVDEISRTA